MPANEAPRSNSILPQEQDSGQYFIEARSDLDLVNEQQLKLKVKSEKVVLMMCDV